jgi:N-acetylmuramoyl-L-alanine amidase
MHTPQKFHPGRLLTVLQVGQVRKASLYVLLLIANFLLLTLPAQAARLQFWRFDSTQNRLDFTTDQGVQPRAQLIANPTRLVIDLPGIRLGRPAVTEPVSSGAIRSLRVGQFDPDTTRIVVELAPGYTLDPNQVKFVGSSAQQWSVQLPSPQFTGVQPESAGDNATTVPVTPAPSGFPSQPAPRFPTQPAPTAGTLVENLRATQDGFFIRTSGIAPELMVQRSRDRRQMLIDLPKTALSPSLGIRELPTSRAGATRLQVSQIQANPPVVRLTIALSPNSPDWQASYSNLGGIVLLPKLGTESTVVPREEQQEPRQSALATIQSVELEGNRQLLIRADGPLTYTAGWDRSTGTYRLIIPSAQLAGNVRGPVLDANSPLLQLRLRQETSRNVVIFLQPASGVQIGDVNQPNRQTLALSLRRSGLFPISPPTSIPVPPATNPMPRPLPQRNPDGRQVIIIDPGHGGPDPGAIGIGGIQEKEIVLDISRQVAALLEQQGVQAVMTRTSDIDLDLEPRVVLAEQLNASLFVSIHANAISLSRPDVNGLEVYYYDSGESLARVMHSTILQSVNMRDRGVRRARFYVLRRTSMPAILIETGYVTGQEDAANFNNPTFRRQLAEAIVRGILNYIR